MDPGAAYVASYAASPSPGWTGAERLRLAAPDGKTLFPSQLAALEQLDLRGHLLCGHHPGAGKTPIGLMAARMIDGPAVVTVPPSLALQWYDRAKEWGYAESELTLVQTRRDARRWFPRNKLTIISDTMLAELVPAAVSLVAIDECHRFKEWDTGRAFALLGRGGVGASARHILGLSGTPAPNGPHELFPFLYRTARSVAPSWDEFTNRYCPTYTVTIAGRQVKKNDKVLNMAELNRKLRETVLHRPHAADVQRQLPPVRRESFRLTMQHSEVSVAQAVEAFEAAMCGEPARLEAFATKRREYAERKARAALDSIVVMVEGGARPLIWCYHQEAAKIIANRLRCPVIHGGVAFEDRRTGIAMFAAGVAPALVATIGAAGTGTDGLQHVCDFAIFVEKDYVPSANDQAEHRIWRTGQNRPVRFLEYRTDDPLEIAQEAVLSRKIHIIESLQA